MAILIQDVVPPKVVKRLPKNEVLIATLYIRGVSIEDIFGKYYEFDEHASHAPRLTVGDVELAGLAKLPTVPVQQPF
jgi:hypothetical protein